MNSKTETMKHGRLQAHPYCPFDFERHYPCSTGLWATAVSIAFSVAHSISISSLLRVRAVVWKRGALQPGGPPLRATTALHPAAVRRVWILNGNVCRLHGYHRSQLLCIEP